MSDGGVLHCFETDGLENLRRAVCRSLSGSSEAFAARFEGRMGRGSGYMFLRPVVEYQFRGVRSTREVSIGDILSFRGGLVLGGEFRRDFELCVTGVFYDGFSFVLVSRSVQ